MAYGNKMIDFLNILGGGMKEAKKLKAIIQVDHHGSNSRADEVEHYSVIMNMGYWFNFRYREG